MNGNYLLLALAFWPMIGALIGYIIGRRNKTARDYFAVFVCAVEMAVVALLFKSASNTNPAVFEWAGFSGFRIYFKLDGFRYIYAFITAFMWLCTTMLSPEYFAHYRNRNRYYFFTLMTLGATMAVFLSADLMTTFLFFEIMSFTSYVQVIHDESDGAKYAAQGYVAVAVIGGLIMLMGIFILYTQIGTTDMALFASKAAELNDKAKLFIAALLILFGFGSKAGMFPLHFWLPQAHPVAPAPASSLLSGVLTKTGIFGILLVGANLFLHDAKMGFVILCLGVVTMFLGALLALFSVDLKRTLACSSVSQIGFIIVGVGMQGILGEHAAIAVHGTMLHMVNHSMFKLLLFMSAGVVYMNMHKLNLNDIRGFGRKKPVLLVCFLIGALGIVGVPGFSGYISKTLIHESIVEKIWLFHDYSRMSAFFQIVEAIFTLSGGLTAAYMTKLFIAVFVEKHPTDQQKMDDKKSYMKPMSMLALVASAVMIPVFGLFPQQTFIKVADFGRHFMNGHALEHEVHFFAWESLKGGVASITIGIILYLLVVRICLMDKDENGNLVYVDMWPWWINLEKYIYRPTLAFLATFFYYIFKMFEIIVNVPWALITHVTAHAIALYPKWDHHKSTAKRIEHYLDDHYTKLIATSLSYGLFVSFAGLVIFLAAMWFL
ncbi:MAG: sodium:proton antiporter [Clostridia bacterium]|nr:sodium:proton antiporter [Clostridia bacterium]